MSWSFEAVRHVAESFGGVHIDPEHFLSGLFMASDAHSTAAADTGSHAIGETVVASLDGHSIQSAANAVVAESAVRMPFGAELVDTNSASKYFEYLLNDIDKMLEKARELQDSASGFSVIDYNGTEMTEMSREDLATYIAQLESLKEQISGLKEADMPGMVYQCADLARQAEGGLANAAEDLKSLTEYQVPDIMREYEAWNNSAS